MCNKFTLLVVAIICVGWFSACRKNTGSPDPSKPEEEEEIPVVIDTAPAVLTAVTQAVGGTVKGYYQAVPSKYNETAINYPLIIFYHGGGQYGNGTTDLWKVLIEGMPKLLEDKKFPPSFTVNNKTFSFIVAIPQFTRRPGRADTDSLIAHFSGKFRIDPKRIYLSGFSLGARSLSEYAAYKPEKVAAITAMGGLIAIDSNLQSSTQKMVNANLPVWQFHNKDDSAWSYSEAQKFISLFNSYTPTVPAKFTTFDIGEGKKHHDCWNRVSVPEYRESGKNIYEWMLSYSR
jgi:predicted peptidase